MPNVVGLAQAAAQTAITGAGLTVGAVTTANSATVPAGQVISQTPASGSSAAPGSAVALVVSLGPAPIPVTVPNVVGPDAGGGAVGDHRRGADGRRDHHREQRDRGGRPVISQTPGVGLERRGRQRGGAGRVARRAGAGPGGRQDGVL